jgi:hypothetical protein
MDRALPRRLFAAAFGLLGGLLLLANTASAVAKIRLPQLPAARFWDDLSIAIGILQEEDFRVQDEEGAVGGVLETYETRVLRTDFRAHLGAFIKQSVEEDGKGLKAWEFWKTVPFRLKPALRHRGRPVPSALEDPGRSWLLGQAFRLRGGVAPFLMLWLAPLLAVPLLVWCALDLSEAGFPAAGALFPLLVASSSFATGTLHMTHSAAGFYILGLILLVPFVFLFRTVARPRDLFLQALLGGLVFALLVVCRGGVLLLLPVFLLGILLGARRLGGGRVLALRGAGAAVLFLLPLLLVKPPERHSTWLGVWEGFGDFDRVKGYVWDGPKAQAAILAAGGSEVRRISLSSPFIGGGYELDIFPRLEEFQELRRAVLAQEDAYEAVARRMVLRDIAGDPAWYAGILLRRFSGTLTQRKLWPYAPRDGISLEPATSPGEGSIDHYYHYTPEGDMFTVAGRVREVPVFPLLAPGALLFLVGVCPRRWVPSLSHKGRPALLGTALFAAGALILPVLITTAGAQETEAFVVVYLLAAALLADVLLTLREPRSPVV